jgi:hypothetical protein
LPREQQEFDSISRNFRFEKNKKYQEFGNYVYKTQITESNSTRTYLKAYVDENADFYLISNYCGRKIEQSSVEVSVDGLFAHTDTIEASNPNYFAFNDEGSHWETLTFKNEADKGVTAFIAHYGSKSVKVTLHGKMNYSYYLENSDKQAIVQTFNLWIVKKDIHRLQFEIKKATAIIKKIKMEKESNPAKPIDKK